MEAEQAMVYLQDGIAEVDAVSSELEDGALAAKHHVDTAMAQLRADLLKMVQAKQHALYAAVDARIEARGAQLAAQKNTLRSRLARCQAVYAKVAPALAEDDAALVESDAASALRNELGEPVTQTQCFPATTVSLCGQKLCL